MKSCPCCWNGCRMHQAHRTACSTWWACKKQKLAIAEAGVARGVFSPPCVTCGSVESWAPKICCDTTSLGRSFPQPGVVAAALPGVAQVQESCLYELFRACHVSDRMNVHRRSLPCWRGSTRLGKRYSLWSPAKCSGTTCVRAAMIKCGYLYQFWGSLYIFDCGQRWQPQPDRVAARTRWQRGPSRNLGLCRLQECIRGRRMLFLEVLSSFACMWSCQECRSWLFSGLSFHRCCWKHAVFFVGWPMAGALGQGTRRGDAPPAPEPVPPANFVRGSWVNQFIGMHLEWYIYIYIHM